MGDGMGGQGLYQLHGSGGTLHQLNRRDLSISRKVRGEEVMDVQERYVVRRVKAEGVGRRRCRGRVCNVSRRVRSRALE